MKRTWQIVFAALMLSLGINQESYGQNEADFPQFNNLTIEEKNQVEIYPNPATEFINIEIKDSDLKETSIFLHNIIGNRIEIQPEKLFDDKYRLEVGNLNPGYYLLTIKDSLGDFSKTYKFLKK